MLKKAAIISSLIAGLTLIILMQEYSIGFGVTTSHTFKLLAWAVLPISAFVSLSSLFGYLILRHSHAPTENIDWRRRKTPQNAYSVHSIRFLVDELRFGNRHVRKEAVRSLTTLLPQMKESDGNLLDPDQRDHLNMELIRLEAWRYPEFRIAILKAWEQVGDHNALNAVRHLAERKYTTASEGPVTEAARQCLPFLIERENQRVHGAVLLRAASPPETPAHELLRPAVSTETAPEQLLRPGSMPG